MAEAEQSDPAWVLLSRPGMSAQRKGPFFDRRLTEQMLRDLYELYPDATCLVVHAPHTMYPEDGREWVAMYGDRSRKRILSAGEVPRGVTEARAPRYLCNKCGATPHVPRHQRPDGKPCDYLAVFIAAGVSVGQPAHSKSEYKRRVAMGDPNVAPPLGVPEVPRG